MADSIAIKNIFDMLTCSSSSLLHFFIYDKYLKTLDKYVSLSLFFSKIMYHLSSLTYVSFWSVLTYVCFACRVLKSAKSYMRSRFALRLNLSDDEIVLAVEGNTPLNPVLKHEGISAWPGLIFIKEKYKRIKLQTQEMKCS